MGLEGIMQTIEIDQPNEFIRRMQEANTNSTWCDAGCIVGFSFGGIAILAIVALAAYWFFMRRGGQGMSMGMPFTGVAAGAGDSHSRVGQWSFKSLVYKQTPDYKATGQSSA